MRIIKKLIILLLFVILIIGILIGCIFGIPGYNMYKEALEKEPIDEKVASIILDDFRSGKFGQITLEKI